MPSNATYVCVPCRRTNRHGGDCPKHGPVQYMGKAWRAPKASNDRAWRRIERGEIWWDRRKIIHFGGWYELCKGQWRRTGFHEKIGA